ncbi:MAG: hypothetical protein ABGW99_19115 [Zunongwangia sp.]|uniref:hypothetical protein n=1 Tax=Zunongwangia sp. TaxID=1965325 RepID=UPI0032424C73
MTPKSNFSSKEFLEKVKADSIEKFQFWRDIQLFYKQNEVDDVELFIRCFPAINEFFKSDYASSQFYTWLEKFSENNPNKAKQIKVEIEKNSSRDNYEFWASIVFGLSKLGEDFEDEIIDNIKSDVGYKVSIGFRTATIIDPKENRSFYSKIDRLIDLQKFKEIFEDIDWAYLMNFYTRHLQHFPKFDSRIKDLFQVDSVYVYSALVGALNSYIELDKYEELFYKSIKHLATTPLEYVGIYNSLTFSLDKYFETNPDTIKYLLENWIDFHLPEAKGMQVLEHLLNNFNDKNPEYFHLLISEWLLKSHNYGLAVQHVISEIRSSGDSLQLDKNWVNNLNDDDVILLALRVVGFAWDKDVAYKMLFQILELNLDSQEIINHTASLIYSELLMNYPSLIERLKKEKFLNNKHKSIIEQIAGKADEYFNELNALPIYDEFKPSEKRLSYYNKIQFRGMGDEATDSKKNSFLDFADKTQLRMGKGFFSKTEQGFTEVMEPKRISHSMEMPRLEFIDPIGQQAKRLHFRFISKDELYNS